MAGNREIGGYLELERFSGGLFHERAIALNSGRACLEYLIELRGIKELFLPDWLCSSVPSVCRKLDVDVETYRIGEDMLPAYDFELPEGAYLYLVDYYGQLAREDVEEARRLSHGKLIVDEAQGFFRQPWAGADTLYTCRKFFGVADGGYLYTKDGAILERELDRDESHGRMGFVLGRFERPAGEFFAESKANNMHFAHEIAKLMSPITENIMCAIDYENVRKTRDRNFAYLHGRLRDYNQLSLTCSEGPFMYPLLVGNAGDSRKRLASNGVFVPILWPNVFADTAEGSVAYRYSENILPLPIDHRYGEKEMDVIYEEIVGSGVLTNA